MVDTEDNETIAHLGQEIPYSEHSSEPTIHSTPIPVHKEPVVLDDEWRGLAELP